MKIWWLVLGFQETVTTCSCAWFIHGHVFYSTGPHLLATIVDTSLQRCLIRRPYVNWHTLNVEGQCEKSEEDADVGERA